MNPEKSHEGLKERRVPYDKGKDYRAIRPQRGQSENTARVLKVPTLFDTTIPLLGMYPRKQGMNVYKLLSVRMFKWPC